MLNQKGKDHYRQQLLEILNSTAHGMLVASYHDEAFDAWLEHLNHRFDFENLSVEIPKYYTRDKIPYVINFTKDMMEELLYD